MDFNQWLQSHLTAHGYPVGLIDGKIGPVTIRALEAFQRANKLKVTGTSDAATVEALRRDPNETEPPVKVPDRTVLPIVNAWPRQADCIKYYGAVGTNQTTIDIPFDMVLAWAPATHVRKMTLHTKVAASAERVLQAVAGIYSEAERKQLGLHLFGGSLNVRKMRGGTSWSMHSWGIAIDFDPERNQLAWGRDKARLGKDDAIPFWQAWEKEGWVSLGRLRNMDYMHVQAAVL